MKRTKNNRKTDKRIFRHTAKKQNSLNIMRTTMRGGIRM